MTPTLRDRIAAAVRAAVCEGGCGQSEEECREQRLQPVVWHFETLAEVEGTPEQIADAVLPLVAAEREAGRRDGLREAANDLAAVANPHTERGAGVRWAADRLRAIADAEDGAR